MNELIENNLQKQIEEVKKQIKQCNDEQFDSLIYKYNVFNNIKNTFMEELLETNEFQKTLETDNRILEKIYNRFLKVNIEFSPTTFDDVMLETFLKEEHEREKELIEIFKKEYIEFPEDKGMLPANATILQEYHLQEINVLIDKGILKRRNCSGLAFEFTDDYLEQVKSEILKEENSKIDYKKCKKILSLDFSKISNIEKLQEYKVKLIDSRRFINDFSEFGQTSESLKRGFIIQVPDLSMDSFIPKDKFMTANINLAIKTIDKRLEELYKSDNEYPILSSGTYKGIFYSVMEDCDENEGGYFIEFFKDLENEYGEIDYSRVLDYMVIHRDNEDEMKNPHKYIEESIDKLIEEQQEENEDELEE